MPILCFVMKLVTSVLVVESKIGKKNRCGSKLSIKMEIAKTSGMITTAFYVLIVTVKHQPIRGRTRATAGIADLKGITKVRAINPEEKSRVG